MEARADLNKYSIEYLYQHIDALVRNVPVEPFNYSMVLDAANQGSIVTLMMRHVARYSDSLALTQEEKVFYKNFTSRKVNKEGDSLVSIVRTEEPHFLQIRFDEQLTPEQAKKISLIYEGLYKAYSVQYIQSTRSLEFKMNLNVFIDNLLEDFFKFNLYVSWNHIEFI